MTRNLQFAPCAAHAVTDTAQREHAGKFRAVGAKRPAARYSIREGRYADPEIYANDVVMAVESNSRRLFTGFVLPGPLLTASLIALLQ